VFAMVTSVVAVAAALVGTVTPTEAAVASQFDPGHLISDSVFYDGRGMSQTEIQSLLNAKGRDCRPSGDLACLKDVRVSIVASPADAYCSAIAAESNVSAARVFAVVGAACGINPAALVVLTEKEQSLVSRSSPTTWSYRFATGYGCPDTAPCSDVTSGFYRQVYFAAKQFERYRLNPTGFRHQPRAWNNVFYHPNSGCGTRSVYIQNYATAGLYNYTPYTPNSAALSNLYGTGNSCSSYGNRNFWRIFTDWFGSTSPLLKSRSFEGTTAGWLTFRGSVTKEIVTDGTAADGDSFVRLTAPATGRSMSQSASIRPPVGATYDASVQVRSGTPDATVSGRLVIWGLGGTTENVVVPFVAGPEWTLVSAQLVVKRAGHTSLRFEVFLDTVGSSLDMDDATMERVPWQPSRDDLTLSQPGFEALGSWVFKNGYLTRSITSSATAYEGSRYLTVATQVPGRSVGQDVAHVPLAGETFTATIWMRSPRPDSTFQGKLVLWALGGTSENSVTRFTVGQEWTPVTVQLPVVRSGHSRLRLEVYLSTTGTNLELDATSLQATLVPDGSFVRPDDAWYIGTGSATIERITGPWGPTGTYDGDAMGRFQIESAGSSVAIGVSRTLRAAETYTATVWLRTEDPEATFSGRMALWALGGASTAATSDIVVDGQWRPYQVTLPVSRTDQSRLKVEIYGSTAGVPVLIDGVTLR
jgi:hypothetical protein